MRKILLVLLIVVLTAYGQGSGPATLASEWLSQQQEENGSFGDDVIATAWSTIALSTTGNSNELALDPTAS